MPDFRLRFEWEESPRVRAPELDATWARLEIYADGEPVTRVDPRRTGNLRNGIYVPLYPIAEWMIANWWFLWDEWRSDGHDLRHSLQAAREGFALPDLDFLPTETKMELRWRPTPTAASGESKPDVLFLSGGSSVVLKAQVKEEFRRLVEAVIERLSAKEVAHSYIVAEWRAILDAEEDPDQRDFCQRAARLGCDPYDVSDSTAARIEHIGALLPDTVAEDFCDAIPLAEIESGAEAVRRFIDSASAASFEIGAWQECREKLGWAGETIPWRDGYNEARALREYLGTKDPISTSLDPFLRQAFGSFEVRELKIASRIEAISAPSRSGAPLFGVPSQVREESKRFVVCRALCDYLTLGLPSLVTRGRAEHQQRNRAFAAEFLAPAESIRQRLGTDRVGEEDIGELAQTFHVSDLVIRHQIQNHNLAWLNA